MKFPRISFVSGTLTLAILLSLGVYSRTFSIGEVDLPREPLRSFPIQLGDYVGRDLPITGEELAVLAPTEVLVRSYRNPEGDVVSLYIPFFRVQNDRSRIHSPKSCMVGGGFRFVKMKPFQLRYRGKEVTVNWVLTKRGDEREVVLYWIHSRGRIMTDEYVAKLYLIWDQFSRHRSDGALVRCITPVKRNETIEEATRRVAAFAQMVMDEAPRYLPE